jgi:hypothetical protein
MPDLPDAQWATLHRSSLEIRSFKLVDVICGYTIGARCTAGASRGHLATERIYDVCGKYRHMRCLSYLVRCCRPQSAVDNADSVAHALAANAEQP